MGYSLFFIQIKSDICEEPKKYLHKKGGQLLLVNGRIIPVSRSRKKDLIGLFNLI